MSSTSLTRANEWSEDLHHALLSERFVLRHSANDSSPILLKFLPHAPSRTLAIVAIPLQTFTPLYEGLSYRTLLRRIKADPAVTAESQDEDVVFQSLVERLTRAINDAAEVECEIGRGEAQLTINNKSATSKFSLSVDLTALDREDGPKFIREHLFSPLASLSLCALEKGDVDEHAQRSHDEQGDSCAELFGNFSAQLTRHTQLLNAITPNEVGSMSTRTEERASKPVTPPPQTSPSRKSPFKTPTRKSPSKTTPDKPPSETTPDQRSPKQPTPKRPSPKDPPPQASPHDSESEEELVVFHPTQTTLPSSSHPSQPTPSGSASSTTTTTSKASTLRDQRLRHNAERDAKASRTHKLMAGAGYAQYLQREDEMQKEEGTLSATDDEEEEDMLARPKVPPASQTQTQSQSQPQKEATPPQQSEDAGAPPGNSPEEDARPTQSSNKAPPASRSPSRTQSPTPTPQPPPKAKDKLVSSAPTPARGSTSATAGQAGRGASSYRRGLAKRKRI